MSITSYTKPKRWKSEKYLEFIRQKPCYFGCPTIPDDRGRRSEPHHLRELFPKGLSTKPSDCFCLPVCRACHDLLEYRRHPEWDDFVIMRQVCLYINEFLATK